VDAFLSAHVGVAAAAAMTGYGEDADPARPDAWYNHRCRRPPSA